MCPSPTPPWPSLPPWTQGLLDCLLTGPLGVDEACRAISAVYDLMSTPGVWVSVSHSPPPDRLELYTDSGMRHFDSVEVRGGGGRGEGSD